MSGRQLSLASWAIRLRGGRTGGGYEQRRTNEQKEQKHRAKVIRNSTESTKNRPKIDRKSTENRPKSVKNRRKFVLGRFWVLEAVSGTRRDALGTGPGRQKAAPGPILGRRGRAKNDREPAKSLPGPVPGRSRTTPERCPSAFSTPGAVERACRTNFRRFCTIAHTLRCASRTSFYSVLLASDEVGTKRARAPKTLENRGVLASEIEPGDRPDDRKSSSGGRGERQKRSTTAFFFSQARPDERTERARTRQERKLRR